jgi:plastocyanin
MGSAFAPGSVEVAAGTTVAWTNRDSVQHTVTAEDVTGGGEPIFDSGPLDQQSSFSHTFIGPGEFPYQCAIHPAMTGSVVVKEVTRRSVSIGIFDDRLDQPDVTVPTGSTVTWCNRSSHPYSVQPANVFASGELQPERLFEPGKPISPGQRFSHTFSDPGDISYSTESSAAQAVTHAGVVHVVSPPD